MEYFYLRKYWLNEEYKEPTIKKLEVEKIDIIEKELKDLSERVENIEKCMKEDKEEQLKKLNA